MTHDLSSAQQQKVTALFNKFGVDYLAVGDFAARKYVDSKYFNHLQLWVKPTPENFQKVQDAFASVRRKLPVDEKAFTTENTASPLTKIGRGHKAIELFTGVPGLSADTFSQSFAARRVLNAGDVPVPILSAKELHRSIQQSSHLNQPTDLFMLERAVSTLTSRTSPQQATALDWREAARTIDPHRLLSDLGYTHDPKKGLLGTSRSQTYRRGEETVVMYPNPGSKPFFMDRTHGKKGDAIDLLNWQHNYDRKEVNRYLKEHFAGVVPTLSTAPTVSTSAMARKKSDPIVIDDKALVALQTKELREKYAVKSVLDKPEFLQSRGLSLHTIFRPEFFKQALSSLGWSNKQQKTIGVDHTVFPMRNDHGVTTMIIRNNHYKGFPQGERRDAVWLSNPPLSLNRDIAVGKGEERINLPKGTEGTLIHNAGKPGHYLFYYQDPHKSGKELNYNKLEVSGKSLEQLTKALNPLQVSRMVLTESPVDALSFHQLAPPQAGETRMYVSTGGQPSEKQQAYINQLVQRVQPPQVVLANDNDQNGVKFNINQMGAIQHPSVPAQHQIVARLQEVNAGKGEKALSGTPLGGTPLGGNPLSEYQLKLFSGQGPQQLEKVAQKLIDTLNRFTPKGQEPPARITYLNGAQGAGSEATIAFPKNDRLLLTAQKQLAQAINEQSSASEPAIKVVRPHAKDFNEDLKQSQENKQSVDYRLGAIPMTLKTQATSLWQQVSGLANNAFDALFGGVPGSLPRLATPSPNGHRRELSEEEPAVQETNKVLDVHSSLAKAMVLSDADKVIPENRLKGQAAQNGQFLGNQRDSDQKEGITTRGGRELEIGELFRHYLEQRRQGVAPLVARSETVDYLLTNFSVEQAVGNQLMTSVHGNPRHGATSDRNELVAKQDFRDIFRLDRYLSDGKTAEQAVNLISTVGKEKLPKPDKDDHIRANSILDNVREVQQDRKEHQMKDQQQRADRQLPERSHQQPEQTNSEADTINVRLSHGQARAVLTAITHFMDPARGKSTSALMRQARVQDFANQVQSGMEKVAPNQKFSIILDQKHASRLGSALSQAVRTGGEKLFAELPIRSITQVTTLAKAMDKTLAAEPVVPVKQRTRVPEGENMSPAPGMKIRR